MTFFSFVGFRDTPNYLVGHITYCISPFSSQHRKLERQHLRLFFPLKMLRRVFNSKRTLLSFHNIIYYDSIKVSHTFQKHLFREFLANNLENSFLFFSFFFSTPKRNSKLNRILVYRATMRTGILNIFLSNYIITIIIKINNDPAHLVGGRRWCRFPGNGSRALVL